MVPKAVGSSPINRPFSHQGASPLSFLEAFLLGLVQGITEFFPVSSSGHLKLTQHLLGLKNLDQYITFDLTCHLGTVLAICTYYRKDLLLLMQRDRLGMLLITALLPLVFLFPFLTPIKKMYASTELLGLFYLISALIIYVGHKKSLVSSSTVSRETKKEAFFIGCFQSMAIFPGISRSGSTISAAKILGWEHERAARFSFLLAIPTICGGSLLEVKELLNNPETLQNMDPLIYLLGFLSSFSAGILSLKSLVFVLKHGYFKFFSLYCLLVSLGCFFLFNLK